MNTKFRLSDLVPAGFIGERITHIDDETCIFLAGAGATASCPACGRTSQTVRSRYCRQAADLPLSGRRVRLLVRARRFSCDAVLCGQRIFAERFGDRLPPYARRTGRLEHLVHHLALAPWPTTLNDAARGTALHLALRTYLTRPDLAHGLPSATELDAATLDMISERATALKNWLAAEGYTELAAEIPVLGFTRDRAEIPGTIDLLAIGSSGCLLIDHKSGGSGESFGPTGPSYQAMLGWSQSYSRSIH